MNAIAQHGASDAHRETLRKVTRRAALYGAALLCVMIAALLRFLLDPFFADRYTYSFFLLAVVSAAFIGGTRPALLATVVAWFVAMFFFVAPRWAFARLPLEEILGSIIFWLVGVAIALIAGRMSFQRRMAELREAEVSRELMLLAERLHVADRLSLMGMLTAGIGHDIGNMLFPMRARLDVLRTQLHRAGIGSEEIENLRASAEYLASLSRGLAHLVADPMSGCAGRTELAPWCEQIRPLLRGALPRSVALECCVPEGLPAVTVAPHALSQAVFNAVQNAGKAIGSRPGRIELFAEREEETGGVLLIVHDDGPGMSEETVRRLNNGRAKQIAGRTGLGVPLIRSIVEASGGAVTIESAPEHGTTVCMNLRAAQAA